MSFLGISRLFKKRQQKRNFGSGHYGSDFDSEEAADVAEQVILHAATIASIASSDDSYHYHHSYDDGGSYGHSDSSYSSSDCGGCDCGGGGGCD